MPQGAEGRLIPLVLLFILMELINRLHAEYDNWEHQVNATAFQLRSGPVERDGGSDKVDMEAVNDLVNLTVRHEEKPLTVTLELLSIKKILHGKLLS